MTRKEIEERLKRIAELEWDLRMTDHWSQSDYDLSNQLFNEERQLKELLKTL